MAKKGELTPKQKAFCEYYLQSGKVTESAIKAGYSKKTATAIGTENLNKPLIKAYISERQAKADRTRIADADEVLAYLTGVMRGTVKDAFGLDASLTDRNAAAKMLGQRYGVFKEVKDVKVEDKTKSELGELLAQRKKRQEENE